jgi:hypothetical protein
MNGCARYDIYYDIITDKCLEYYESRKQKSIFEIATDIMDVEGFPIHCPQHHYLVPAVLLTACRQMQGELTEQLKQDLSVADKRARNVLPGFCGWYGACGVAIGVGIFMSIFTHTNPLSEKSWSWTNKATAQTLLKISKVNGPRCCKRSTYIGLDAASRITKECLGITLKKPRKLACKYYDRNTRCKREECPFYLPKGFTKSIFREIEKQSNKIT